MIPNSTGFYSAMGGISLGVALTGGIYAPWPWWLTIFQGLTSSLFFILAVEFDPKLNQVGTNTSNTEQEKHQR